jgi:ankyrin repeat protein
VKAGGDVNARDNRGQTALHAAALFGYDDVIKDLMVHNANINAKGMRQWRVSCRRHDSRPNQ